MTPDLFAVRPEMIIAILAMCAATFGLKVAGYLTTRFLNPTPAIERFLNALPAGVLLSFVAPMVVTAGAAGVTGLIAALACFIGTRRMLLSTFVGVAAGLIVRHSLPLIGG
ncbi:MAG: AzlD domain-containing protein [Pseudomonadota bacterium]